MGDLGFKPKSHFSLANALTTPPTLDSCSNNKQTILYVKTTTMPENKKNMARDSNQPIGRRHLVVFFNENPGYLPADFIRS